MKQYLTSLAVVLTAIATAQAGTTYEGGNVSMDRPGCESGQGFYIGAQGGANLYQTTDSFSDSGVSASTKSKVGGFGGLKLGYVGGSVLETLRPAVELDGFYNGCSQDTEIHGGGFHGNVGKLDMDSGAFLVNGIARFALGSVQPYVGVGAGLYTAKIKGPFDYSSDKTGFAWQLIAGVDCYVTSSISIFAEYKFLNYTDISDSIGEHQQLLGGGVRFHF